MEKWKGAKVARTETLRQWTGAYRSEVASSDDSLDVRIDACGSGQLRIADARLRCMGNFFRWVGPTRAPERGRSAVVAITRHSKHLAKRQVEVVRRGSGRLPGRNGNHSRATRAVKNDSRELGSDGLPRYREAQTLAAKWSFRRSTREWQPICSSDPAYRHAVPLSVIPREAGPLAPSGGPCL